MKKTNRVPDDIRDVFEAVYKKADAHKYIAKGRPENSVFMNQLVADPTIGGKLNEHMAKSKVKTYIKDTILNRYAKEKKSLPEDINEILETCYKAPIHEAGKYIKKDHLSFHRASDDTFIIAGRINYLKWETAIRKVALYAAQLATRPEKLDLVVIIFEQGTPVNTGDRAHVTKAIELLGVKIIWRE